MCTAMSSSHGSGSGSVVGGSGPQSNLKGSGNDHEKRHYGRKYNSIQEHTIIDSQLS